jgi:hypothetical protein
MLLSIKKDMQSQTIQEMERATEAEVVTIPNQAVMHFLEMAQHGRL